MVCGGIGAAVHRHGAFDGMFVWSVFLRQRTMRPGALGITEIGIDQCQVEMGGQILRILRQDMCKLSARVLQQGKATLFAGGAALLPGTFVQRTAEHIARAEVLREIEAALPGLGKAGLEQGPERRNGLLQMAVLAVDQRRQPGARPRPKVGMVFGRTL